MINNLRVLAVVPARAGSKRCPGKNLRDYRGKPLLQWTFDAAKGSKYIDRTVLSTEDPKVKELALSIGFEIVDRPPELAQDSSMNEEVMKHALSLFPADLVVLLQPTSPLRLPEDIDACIEKGHEGCVTLRDTTFHKNGAAYCCPAKWIEEGYSFSDFTNIHRFRRWSHTMPESRSLDIDYPEEFNL